MICSVVMLVSSIQQSDLVIYIYIYIYIYKIIYIIEQANPSFLYILKVFIDSTVTATVGENLNFSLISKHLLVWKDSSKTK